MHDLITPEKIPKRNVALDVLRGVLAWLVVVLHVAWFAGYTHSGVVGWLGVQAVNVFMALAGYVAILTYRHEPYTQYLIKRFFRIAPVLVLCWVLALVAHSGLKPAWFIWLLIQFYLVFPLIMWAIDWYGRRALLVLAAASLLCYLPPARDSLEPVFTMYEFLPQNMLLFVAGMLAFYLVSGDALSEVSFYAERFPRAIWLGQLSYSTYLSHWPLLALVSYVIPHQWGSLARMAAIAAVGVPVTLVASVLVYRFIELPGIALGKKALWVIT